MANLSGRWVGHYFDKNNFRKDCPAGEDRHAFAISADLLQEGGRLTGTMTDLVTDLGMTIKEHLEVAPEEYTAKQREVLTKLTVRDPSASVTATLAERSRIEGAVSGQTVCFLKLYQGQSTTNLQADDHTFSQRRAGHAVEYEGMLCDDDTLEGEWVVRQKKLFGLMSRISNQGTFRLKRFGSSAGQG